MTRSYKRISIIVACSVLASLFIVLGGREAVTQIRAALVRDIDTPSLAPFRAAVDYQLSYLNDQRLLTTVPAGKRLVIEYISYWSGGATGDQMVYGSLRNGQYGPEMVMLEIHPPHASADSAFTIQDGSQPMKAYFEAGEQVWVSVSHNTSGFRDIRLQAFGHYITP